jgi:hypothetical protein
MRNQYFRKPIRRESLLQAILGDNWAEKFEYAHVPEIEVEVNNGEMFNIRYYSGPVTACITPRFIEGSMRMHRVRVKCPGCNLWLPCGRVQQHSCNSENSKKKLGLISNSFRVVTDNEKRVQLKLHKKLENARKSAKNMVQKYPGAKLLILDNCGRVVEKVGS